MINSTMTNSTLQDTTTSDDDSTSFMDYFSVVVSNLLLFFLIFGLSATVDVKNLKRQWRNKFAIGTGVAMQFLIMPVLGFVAVMALRDQGLTSAMGITLLVVTSSPGGSYSNWWCSTFNADLALSVTMTSISSLISIGALPANLFLYTYLAYGVFGNSSNDETDTEDVVQALDFKSIFITLGVVLGAILTGLLAGYKWDTPRFHVACNRMGTICGFLLIIFSILLSFSSGGDDEEEDEENSGLFSHSWAFYVGVAFPCLVGILLANIISRTCFRLSPPECVTLSIECCYQNVGIATSVAVTMFQDNPTERAQAIAVPLFYGLVEAVAIGIYCIWAWKAGWTKAPRDEKFCIVVTKTYEVEANTEEETEQPPQDPKEHHEDVTESETEWGQRGSSMTSSKTDSVKGSRSRLVSEDTAVTCSTMLSHGSGSPDKSLDAIDGAFGMVALEEGYESYDSDQQRMDDKV